MLRTGKCDARIRVVTLPKIYQPPKQHKSKQLILKGFREPTNRIANAALSQLSYIPERLLLSVNIGFCVKLTDLSKGRFGVDKGVSGRIKSAKYLPAKISIHLRQHQRRAC